MKTGDIELHATRFRIINTSEPLPFPLHSNENIHEEIRLQYRYLDLRQSKMQESLKKRSLLNHTLRSILHAEQFTEIETPYLTKATAEGSRDFIVPARLQPGKFFALPQSPQQYKQLLMVGGFERYFQIARCFRDEDPRADRGFEHSQIDLEMSFVEQADVMELVEAMMIEVAEGMGMKIKEKPFPRFTYAEAMEKFGADKFDLRTEEEKEAGDVLAYSWVVDFPFFEKAADGQWTFTHNPFSNPLPEWREDHLAGTNIEKILTSQYDLVCNGYEAGGGSIRAHEPEVLKATYKNMGYTEEETVESVGHMIEAFEYGAPPHGGIALGVERTLMTMTGEESLRETQAFPMTGRATTSIMDAPSEVTGASLQEAHIKLDI